VLTIANGNRAEIVDAWRSRDTMHSVGKFLAHFRRLGLQGYDIGGDEGYCHQLMDRMAEEGYHLQRFNSGQANRDLHKPCGRMVVNGRPAHRTQPSSFPTMRSSSPSSPVAESNTIARAARSSNQGPTFEPAVSSRQTAPMPSSAQSSSARNHKSTGKPPSPSKKKSNIACTSTICAQAGADRISPGHIDGALASLRAKAQPEPADCGARCECCSRTALYQDRWLPKKTPVSRVILAP
jgi:hypothetical protein